MMVNKVTLNYKHPSCKVAFHPPKSRDNPRPLILSPNFIRVSTHSRDEQGTLRTK